MNILLYVSNQGSKYFRHFLLRLVVILVIFNILGIMCYTKFEERGLQNKKTSRTHRCKYIGDFALRVNCELWSCWESQLRDRTRIEFLIIYNKFRTSVIQKQCEQCQYYEDYPVMIQLEWHWKLEQESQKAINNCPYQDFKSNIQIDTDGNNNSKENTLMQCEMVASSFPIQSGSQSELIQMLPLLLYGNHLLDFNSDNKYRRNLALFIGCSYVPRILTTEQTYSANSTLKESVGHLLCYYCSREKSIHSAVDALKNCPSYATKSTINEFPLLCKVKKNEITMPCESRIIPCPLWKKTYSWIFPHLSDMVAQLDNGTNLLMADYLNKFDLVLLSNSSSASNNDASRVIGIPITSYVEHDDFFDRKFCIVQMMIYVLILTLMFSAILLIYYFHVMTRQIV